MKGFALTKLGLYVDDQTTLNCVKVFVNFIADWPRGVHRVWKSDNWGNTIPLIEDEHKNLVPLYVSLFDLPSLYMKIVLLSQEVTRSHHPPPPNDSSSSEDELPPGSQNMMKRPHAKNGTKKDKQNMKTICEKCFTGNFKETVKKTT